MKKFLLTSLCAVLCGGFAFAQDINEAIELYNAGVKAYQEKNYELAVQSIEKALSIALSVEAEETVTVKENCESIIPTLYLAQARDYAAAKKTDEAIAALNKAAETAEKYGSEDVKESADKLYPQIYTSAGTTYFNDKKYMEAVEMFKKVLEYTPGNSTIQLRIGQAYAQAKDDDNAITELTAARELASQTGNAGNASNAGKLLARIYFSRAVMAQRADKWEEAFAQASLSMEQDNTNTQAAKLLGSAAVQLKKWDEAIENLEKILPEEKNPDNTIYSLAMAYEAKGNSAKACENYRKITGNPTFKAYAEAKVKELCK
jgi:tetratricopeptide (TPR) repeat protein